MEVDSPTPTFDLLVEKIQSDEDYEPSAREVIVSIKEVYDLLGHASFTLGYQVGMIGYLLSFFDDDSDEPDGESD